MRHVARAARWRPSVPRTLACLLLALGVLAAPAAAQDAPTGQEMADRLGISTAALEQAAGVSLDELERKVQHLGEGAGSAALADYSGGNVLNLTSVGAHDSGGLSCTGFGRRDAPEDGANNRWWVHGRHKVDCPPLVTNSWCEIRVYFPNRPDQRTMQHSVTGNNHCDADKWDCCYGWDLHGNMQGQWMAVATAYWVNNYPRSCESSQFFIICAYNTAFDIPGFGDPWDSFNWKPSGGAWWKP
ncbi:MAG TPA: hypothetical protein VF529_10075 [Solirubrobacteraceae bacterium]|jgi:hypothetical protein